MKVLLAADGSKASKAPVLLVPDTYAHEAKQRDLVHGFRT